MELRFLNEEGKQFTQGLFSSKGDNMDTENVNIHQMERAVSVGLGGLLLIRSIRRRSLGGGALASILLYRGISGHSYLYQALGMSTAEGNKQHGAGASESPPEVVASITIGKPAQELYRLWREPQSLSQIMGELAQVTQVSDDRQHWELPGPFKKRIEWDTQVMEDQPGKLLRWKSLDGAPLSNEGWLSFRPAPRDWGTEVTLRFRFDPPGGVLGKRIAGPLKGVTRLLAEKALRRYKSLAETGEIPTLKHNPAARRSAYAHA
jgi:uncharacterized membrane protein